MTTARSIYYKLKLYGLWRFLFFAFSEIFMLLKHRITNSYSQSNDDLIIDRLLHYKQKGFYIDIGAYDPVRFSNTMRFYNRGWKGINIEPDYEQYKIISSVRGRDINLNIGIASKSKTIVYWQMNPKTLSTFSSTQAKAYKRDGFQIVKKMYVPVLPLSKVINEHAKSKVIDFLSVDVEGFELDVLHSNNWKLYRPTVLCIELSFDKKDSQKEIHRKQSIMRFIESKGYKYITKSLTNFFYVDVTRQSQKRHI